MILPDRLAGLASARDIHDAGDALMRWTFKSFLVRLGSWLSRRDCGSISIVFAMSVLPIMLAIGLAVDWSLYVRARAQLNSAADTGALQAVRTASQGSLTGTTSNSGLVALGNKAGAEWFAAQAGTINNAVVPANGVSVSTAVSGSPSKYTATVSYSGTVNTFFAQLFGVDHLAISGTASAAMSTAYVEVVLMLDNSPSMLIGATSSDIKALEQAVPCSTQSASEGAYIYNTWSWTFTNNYGYNYFINPPNVAPPSASVNGNCDKRYTGDPTLCIYIPKIPNIDSSNTWLCTNNGGLPYTSNGKTSYYAQSPCAFACHDKTDGQDYYGLARSISPNVTLRLDVVYQAASNVITSLQSAQAFPGQFDVGIWNFSTGNVGTNGLVEIYPSSGEAGTDFSAALSAINAAPGQQPVTPMSTPSTNFPAAVSGIVAGLTAAGDGSSPVKAIKNVFIVTDGMQDASNSLGPMTSITNEANCSKYWNKGFNVYVLYIPYLPLVHDGYLSSIKQYVESASAGTDPPDVAALKACARVPQNFYVASDPGAINGAMQAMLANALSRAGTLTN